MSRTIVKIHIFQTIWNSPGILPSQTSFQLKSLPEKQKKREFWPYCQHFCGDMLNFGEKSGNKGRKSQYAPPRILCEAIG